MTDEPSTFLRSLHPVALLLRCICPSKYKFLVMPTGHITAISLTLKATRVPVYSFPRGVLTRMATLIQRRVHVAAFSQSRRFTMAFLV